MAFDAEGHLFTYIVDTRTTLPNACLTFMTSGLTPGITITTTTASGGITLGNTVYALISHGKQGYGSWTIDGTRINTGNTDNDMTTDAGFGNGQYNWLTNGGILVQKAMTPTFDTLVYYRSDLAKKCNLLSAKMVAARAGN